MKFEGEELGDQGWFEDDWSADTWSEDWWSDDLVAAVFGDGTWDDDWWWSTWDDGWSDGWTDTSWSVVQPPAVEKATSSAAPAAPEPTATSGAPVSAVTLEPPPPSKAKAKATSKASPKASGFAIAALTLGSMFAGTSSCVVSSPGLDASLDGMLDGCVAFNDFSVSGTCVDSSLQLPTWELSPVMYHLPHQDQLGYESSLFHPKTLQDWGLGHLDTSFFNPYLAEHESVVASVGQGEDETWILFDSGAAANCCPRDFAPEFPLLQLDEKAPSLKSISGQTLNIYGRKLVAFETEGKRLRLNFYVCDVPYSVISVARILQQGCKATLSSEGSRLEGPSGESTPVVKYGSLLFLCPKPVSFDPSEYSDFSTSFHAQFAARPPPGLFLQLSRRRFSITLIVGYLTAPIIL